MGPVQTVQLQCGNCSNMMAISVEHLGAQVQCPHCSAVVQTPPRSALESAPGPDPAGAAVQPPAPPPPQHYQPAPQQYQPSQPQVHVTERESIFSEPEPSDDLFGGDASPKIHMPEPHSQPAGGYGDAPSAEEHGEEQADLSAMRSRMAQERKSSSLAPTLLVFLVPYAILTTAFIAYLLMNWPKLEHFEWFIDPNQKNKPKLVSFLKREHPIPPKLKVPLNEMIRVGQMEITPLKVERRDNVLTLKFKAKNVSSNLLIEPIERAFFDEKLPGAGYTYLEGLGKNSTRIFGGDLEFFNDKNKLKNGELMPGQECIVELSTGVGPTLKDRVKSLLSEDGRFQWRLQFRRGIHSIHGVETPLTAVIGVEFSKNDISGT